MKFTFSAACFSSPPVIAVPQTVVQTVFVVTAEQLAQTWNRPLAQIRARIEGLGKNPSDRKMARFYRWLMANGVTQVMKDRVVTNTEEQ
jgi:hypothetical protein